MPDSVSSSGSDVALARQSSAQERALRGRLEMAAAAGAREASALDAELARTRTAIDAELSDLNSQAAAPANNPAKPEHAAADGAELVRTRTSHGPEYDAMVERGIPRRMVRRAWVATGGVADEAMDFIRANFDQPSAFWELPVRWLRVSHHHRPPPPPPPRQPGWG
jgi:hypothetical protein